MTSIMSGRCSLHFVSKFDPFGFHFFLYKTKNKCYLFWFWSISLKRFSTEAAEIRNQNRWATKRLSSNKFDH